MREKPRVVITTDLEVDDMNSIIHLCLYLNELDVEAFVYTASQYHFLGDGEHALGEVNPHWRTKGRASYEQAVVPAGPDPEARELMSYRPFPEGWLEDLWAHEYAEAWPYLQQNTSEGTSYPSPEELLARTYVGNVAFEGDVREPTPGSEAVRRAIMDDDPRTLWLLSWGGMNTIVRALMSIAEEYQGTPAWPEVQARVYRKVRVMGVMNGVGQDNSWVDHGRELFPDLKLVRTEFAYGGYVDAVAAQADARPLFKAPWPEEHVTRGNGPLMARYMLYGDGREYPDEPERFQFGKHATLDWGIPGMEPIHFAPGDFMAEGDSMQYIPLLDVGLRGVDEPWYEGVCGKEPGFDTILGRLWLDGEEAPELPYDYYSGKAAGGSGAALSLSALPGPNPYLRAYQEEFAARAQWCAHPAGECNHAPVIEDVVPDVVAAPGEAVAVYASAIDPDGDALSALWTVDELLTNYSGMARNLRVWEPARFQTHFTVPADAAPGDRFVLTLEVTDAPTAVRPLTRYVQVAVTVG